MSVALIGKQEQGRGVNVCQLARGHAKKIKVEIMENKQREAKSFCRLM